MDNNFILLTRSIGFTGTREGMSNKQLDVLEALLNRASFREAHHGDCVGADEQFHMIVDNKKHTEDRPLRIVIHPPDNPTERAFCIGDVMNEVKPYLVRNDAIVKQSQVLIACPLTNKEEQRSGTWHTIRSARKAKHKIYIILPDGTIKEEG